MSEQTDEILLGLKNHFDLQATQEIRTILDAARIEGRNIAIGNVVETLTQYSITISPDYLDLNGTLQTVLDKLITSCQRLPITSIPGRHPTYHTPHLSDVYVEQNLEEQPYGTPTKLWETYQYYVLLGEPGGGKTSYIKYLASELAKLRLTNEGIFATNTSWPLYDVFPVYIELEHMATWMVQHPHDHNVWSYLADRGAYDQKVINYLNTVAREGKLLFLFDDLGAINENHLKLVRTMLEDLVSPSVGAGPWMIVTCRSMDYSNRQLAEWPSVTLQPLSEEQQRGCINNWFAKIAPKMTEARGNLINQLDTFQPLAETPLTLILLIQLYASATPPKHAHEVFPEGIKLLIRDWEHLVLNADKGTEQLPADQITLTLIDKMALSDRQEDWITLLTHLAYRSLITSSEQTTRTEISEEQFVGAVSGYFHIHAPDERKWERAGAFAYFVNRHSSGVVYSIGQNPLRFRFTHDQLREFLAAKWLFDNWSLYKHDWNKAQPEWGNSEQWNNVVVILINQLVYTHSVVTALEFLETLLQPPAKASESEEGSIPVSHLILAGEGILRIPQDMLRKESHASMYVSVKKDIQTQIEKYLEHESEGVKSAQTVALGKLLSKLGDSRQGVTTEEPLWCDVESGEFLYGSTPKDPAAVEEEFPQRSIELAEFQIARYPVTVAQFRRFIDDDGYREQRWWTQDGWALRQEHEWQQPRFWPEVSDHQENLPVVGVSWYEATAFCAWLSQQLGYPVTLPTEYQWEKAARGDDGRIYPPVGKWDAEYGNTKPDEQKAPGVRTPVGCYPAGASVYDVLDMAGNVWEWTIPIGNGSEYMVRGGSYQDGPKAARCASRLIVEPTLQHNSIGFRVVRLS